ncbi:MAG: GNAT family N-acetyltransferase [Candidatus Aminicenantales bacterium]
MKITVKAPAQCAEQELDEFQRLVEMGREVISRGLRGRIRGASLLAFGYVGDSGVGIAALKNPSSSYKKNVFEKSGLIHRSYEFEKELGWVYIEPKWRKKGFSSKLVKTLLSHVKDFNVFATSRTDNQPMHKVLKKNGFFEAGNPFISDQRHKLILFLWDSIAMRA